MPLDGSNSTQSESFPSRNRIRKSEEIQFVLQTKKSVADKVLVIYAANQARPCGRLGLSVSRRVGNAVVRNSWKRRIREAYRRNRLGNLYPIDIVVIPRGNMPANFMVIETSLLKLCEKLMKRLKID